MILIPDGWKKKRKYTLYTFVVQYFLFSVEWTTFILIKLPYLKTIIDDDADVKLFYGLISISYLIVSIFAAPFVAKYVDKTRRVKETLILSNIAIIIGNIIFALPYSPYFLLIGRFVAGIGISSTSIVVSEIARSYDKNEVSKKISIAMSGYMLGFLLGPCIGGIFTGVNLKISDNFILSYGNSASLFLALCFLLFTVIMSFTVHNLSLEFDLKATLANEVEELYTENNVSKGMIECFENENLVQSNQVKSRREVFTNPVLILMYSLSTLFQTNIVAYDMWVPLLVTNILKWETLYTNTVFLIIAVITFIILSITSKFKMSSNVAFLLLILSITFIVDTISILEIIKRYPHHMKLDIPLFGMFVLMYSITSSVYMAIIIPLINNMVPSEYQTFAESLRFSTVRIGSCVTLMTAPYIFDGLYICSIVMLIVNIIHILFVIKYRRVIRTKF